ncbi:MAG: 5-formyltetrahydrofolate cyclo-ligase [Candidatus Symbiobacter sp.]|nr:5-formyltetrahydrofolate cyclo-ligase [Candidatus Symbiobacter sp.]
MNPELTEVKKKLRDEVRRRRRALAPEYFSQCAQAIAQKFTDGYEGKPQKIVAGYMPGRFEASPLILMEKLAQIWACHLCLPVVVAAEYPLIFRAWRPDDELIQGNGAMIPKPESPAIIPDMILVPLIAFDAKGGRLGQGGGYYDRTLAELRRVNPSLPAIGIALDVQQIDEVPRDENDFLLDGIVTESQFLSPKPINKKD